MKKVKVDFFDGLFEKENGIDPIFSELAYADNGQMVYQSGPMGYESAKQLKNLYFIQFFPDYLKATVRDAYQYNIKKYPHVKGYAINIEGYIDIETYLKHQFKANSKTIRRYVHRLEACFDITYKLYFGAMDQPTYESIFDTLQLMLSNRFRQRQERDQSRQRWDRVRRETLALIHAKRASLFVICDGQKPIEISINYHFKDILHSSISSYDIDYAKFGLGHVEIYKQVEWCIANNYKLFEMGRGDLDYKRRWSNTIYNFEYQIIYPKDSLLAKSTSRWLSFAIQLKLYLKSKILPHLPLKAKGYFHRKDAGLEHAPTYMVTKIEDTAINNISPNKIDINKDSHAFLRRGIYDLLYAQSEYLPDLEIYEIAFKTRYSIKGKKGFYALTVS